MFKWLGFSRKSTTAQNTQKQPIPSTLDANSANTGTPDSNVENTSNLISKFRQKEPSVTKPPVNPADPKIMALRTLYTAWKQKPGLSEQNARLLACSGIDITISNFPFRLLIGLCGYLYVPRENPPTVLSMLIISALYQACGIDPKDAPNPQVPELELERVQYDLTIKRSAAILNFTIENASEKFESPDYSIQFSMLMRFGAEEQKALALHYLVGEFNVLDQEKECQKAARLACLIVKYYSLWVKTASAKSQNRYTVFTQSAEPFFPSLFAPSNSSSAPVATNLKA